VTGARTAPHDNSTPARNSGMPSSHPASGPDRSHRTHTGITRSKNPQATTITTNNQKNLSAALDKLPLTLVSR
jgi:hypothetical protein